MMKIDGPFYASLDNAAAEARRLAAAGYDGVYTLEGNTDPFFPLVVAAEPCTAISMPPIFQNSAHNTLSIGFRTLDLYVALQSICLVSA